MHGLPPPQLGSVQPPDVRPPSRASIAFGLLRMAAALSLIAAIVVALEFAAVASQVQPSTNLTFMEDPSQ